MYIHSIYHIYIYIYYIYYILYIILIESKRCPVLEIGHGHKLGQAQVEMGRAGWNLVNYTRREWLEIGL